MTACSSCQYITVCDIECQSCQSLFCSACEYVVEEGEYKCERCYTKLCLVCHDQSQRGTKKYCVECFDRFIMGKKEVKK